jgi:hypothetical protein
MRFIGFVFLLCIVTPGLAFARMGGDGSMSRYRISGFYGLMSVSPTDVNNYLSNQATTPKLGALTSGSVLGGELGITLTPRWEVEFAYDQADVKNPTNTTLPPVNNAGIELKQNTVWGGLNFFIVDMGPVHASVGGLIGYPTYAHATITSTTNSDFDASRQLVYMGKANLDFMFTRHVSVFFEGGYQFMAQGALSNTSGNLTYPGNTGVKMDLSGLRGQAGVSIHF